VQRRHGLQKFNKRKRKQDVATWLQTCLSFRTGYRSLSFFAFFIPPHFYNLFEAFLLDPEGSRKLT